MLLPVSVVKAQSLKAELKPMECESPCGILPIFCGKELFLLQILEVRKHLKPQFWAPQFKHRSFGCSPLVCRFGIFCC